MCTIKRIRFKVGPGHAGVCSICSNEKGVALITTLVILMTLALLGAIALQSSIREIKIAGSDRRHKDAFYSADGSMELASELLEQNIESAVGFGDDSTYGGIHVTTGQFWLNSIDVATTPTQTNRDFYLSAGSNLTNFKLGGRTEAAKGAAIQMSAGYEGKGKSAAHGGSNLIYDINAQHMGPSSSEAVVRVQWRHVN